MRWGRVGVRWRCGVWGEVWAWVVEFDVVNFVTMLPS